METEEIIVEIQKAAETIAKPNCAAWLSILLSLLAIVVAGYVALKQANISEQQNKIALFEKKYKVYCELFKIVNIGDQLDYPGPHTCFSLLHEVEVICGIKFTDKDDVNAQLREILTQIKQSEYIIKQSAFLFNCINEEDISKLIDALMDCMIFILKGKKKEINIKDSEISEFIKVSKSFNSKYLDSIETELTLN